MSVREVARRIIAVAESVSGHPVLIEEDESIATVARVRMSRGGAHAHVISYRPAARSELDYLIAYQCGFIIRVFSLPPAERRDLAPTARGREIVDALVRDGAGRKLAPAVCNRLRDQLFDGLMLQLRSIPIGLRVDAWILREYPELTDLQRASALRQLQENQQVLSPEVRRIAPAKIYRSSVAMNAAFASFWARVFPDTSLTLPYRAAGFDKAGAELAARLDELPDEPGMDCALIDAWGDILDLASWYEWVPFGATSAPAA